MPVHLADYFPFWSELTPAQQSRLQGSLMPHRVEKDTLIHNGSADCVGLLLVVSGRLRVFILSEEGKEITLYRLLEQDICLFSASCIFRSIQFDVMVEAETPTEFLQIPNALYEELMRESAPVANYTNELMAARFSDVMWLLNQILYKKLDSRLAAFLLEESLLAGSETLHLTHEEIANHLGSAREVVTRMLKYFSNEGLVALSRGVINISDAGRLRALAEE